MEKSVLLSCIDDLCAAEFLDKFLGFRTHKMCLDVNVFPLVRNCHRMLEKNNRMFYENSLSKNSRIIFKQCNYLPMKNTYKPVMVVANENIKKNTELKELSGHYFPIADKYLKTNTSHCLLFVNILQVYFFLLFIIDVNNFSIKHSIKSNKLNVLLGPLSYVNHACMNNSIFKPSDGVNIYVVTTSNIAKGEEISFIQHGLLR